MKYHAPYALLPDGWSASVAIDVDDAGTIVSASAVPDAAGCEKLAGPVVPAMPNLHSHAFQRALAGRTGRASTNHDDSFWSWRKAMYELVGRLDPEAVEAVAAQAYIEMAKAGYACVGEFHYLHHDPNGNPYADPAELAMRVVAAAETAGLRLTLLPVFYAHAGFGGQPPGEGQRRFVHGPDSFARLLDVLRSRASRFVLGVAPHSLRAVTREELLQVVHMVDPATPVHIHAAEQTREVDECYAASGMRPVEWLLSYARLDERWCIVHATHVTEREIAGLAASGAVAGLAPTTEADLGDGAFPGLAYLAAGGHFGVGSDSNTMISPFAELRQLEWSQRVRTHRRNVLATDGATIGTGLWKRAAIGGAQALAQPVGAIAPGMRADLVVLNDRDPALTLQAPEDLLDAAIFGPAVAPVRDVLVGGRFVVREGRHPQEEAVLARYRDTLARLA